jgi:hypothetical protein
MAYAGPFFQVGQGGRQHILGIQVRVQCKRERAAYAGENPHVSRAIFREERASFQSLSPSLPYSAHWSRASSERGQYAAPTLRSPFANPDRNWRCGRPGTLWNTTCCKAAPSRERRFPRMAWLTAPLSVPFMHPASPHPITAASSELRRHPQ